jgi:hypothetical protein
VSGLGTLLETFLKQYLFTSSRIMARHFCLSPTTIKEILNRELGFRKNSWRRMSHRLSDSQEMECVEGTQSLLEVFRTNQQDSFQDIPAGNKS